MTLRTSLEAADLSITLDLGMADYIILATATAYKAEVVTSDEHLRNLDGVKFISRKNDTDSNPRNPNGFAIKTEQAPKRRR